MKKVKDNSFELELPQNLEETVSVSSKTVTKSIISNNPLEEGDEKSTVEKGLIEKNEELETKLGDFRKKTRQQKELLDEMRKISGERNNRKAIDEFIRLKELEASLVEQATTTPLTDTKVKGLEQQVSQLTNKLTQTQAELERKREDSRHLKLISSDIQETEKVYIEQIEKLEKQLETNDKQSEETIAQLAEQFKEGYEKRNEIIAEQETTINMLKEQSKQFEELKLTHKETIKLLDSKEKEIEEIRRESVVGIEKTKLVYEEQLSKVIEERDTLSKQMETQLEEYDKLNGQLLQANTKLFELDEKYADATKVIVDYQNQLEAREDELKLRNTDVTYYTEKYNKLSEQYEKGIETHGRELAYISQGYEDVKAERDSIIKKHIRELKLRDEELENKTKKYDELTLEVSSLTERLESINNKHAEEIAKLEKEHVNEVVELQGKLTETTENLRSIQEELTTSKNNLNMTNIALKEQDSKYLSQKAELDSSRMREINTMSKLNVATETVESYQEQIKRLAKENDSLKQMKSEKADDVQQSSSVLDYNALKQFVSRATTTERLTEFSLVVMKKYPEVKAEYDQMVQDRKEELRNIMNGDYDVQRLFPKKE